MTVISLSTLYKSVPVLFMKVWCMCNFNLVLCGGRDISLIVS